MKTQAIKVIDNAILHLEQMDIIAEAITFDTLVNFVKRQIWTKKPVYHNVHFIHAIALIAWNSTNKGKMKSNLERQIGLNFHHVPVKSKSGSSNDPS
tara:strand:+ start:201 stop:491 length:291 start_codon:yes stop_codon:yes gene_type:complete